MQRFYRLNGCVCGIKSNKRREGLKCGISCCFFADCEASNQATTSAKMSTRAKSTKHSNEMGDEERSRSKSPSPKFSIEKDKKGKSHKSTKERPPTEDVSALPPPPSRASSPAPPLEKNEGSNNECPTKVNECGDEDDEPPTKKPARVHISSRRTPTCK